jgi:hypothetical protein
MEEFASTAPPARRGRRVVARGIDALLSFVLSAMIVWPMAWNAGADALASGGFGSALDFLRAGPSGADAGSEVARAAAALQPVLLGALLLQAVVVWLYETLAVALTGTTPGKAMTRLRITHHHGPPGPTLAPPLQPQHRSWAGRALRSALRAALVVGPASLSLVMLTVSLLGAEDATEVAEIAIATTLVLAVIWLADGRGAHGLASGTHVVPFSWREVRSRAEAYARDETTRERLRQRAEASGAAGWLEERAQRLRGDPRVTGLQERLAKQDVGEEARTVTDRVARFLDPESGRR